MKNLILLTSECMKELDMLRIPYGNILELEVNTRAMKRWGQCKKISNGYSINISARLLEDSISDQSTKETILHELLHTCENCFDHGIEWKRLAQKVNQAYGYQIKRTTEADEKGIAEMPVLTQVKHRFHCAGCGAVIERVRESKFTKNYHQYRCSKCGAHFIKEF